MDLVKLITDKVQEVETSGKLEEIIEKKVLKCLEDIVSDSFNWNGEAKASIKEALKGKLSIDPEKLNLHKYQKIVTGIIEEHANNTMIENLSSSIKSSIDDITENLEKKTWKLSEIIRAFIGGIDKSYDGEMDEECGELTLHVRLDGEFTWIHFDKESDKANYSCDNKISLYKGKISNVCLDKKDFSPFVMSSMCDFEKFMFRLYCNNVEVIVDDGNCELDYYREDFD